MTAALAARPFEARITPAQQRARAYAGRLRWAIFAMALLNVAVWGSMIGAARGMIDLHSLADQAWALGSAWLAALPQVTITVTH